MRALLKSGLADREIIYSITTIQAPWTWAKFKPIFVERRKRYSGRDAQAGFEYLADEMMRLKLERDSGYKIPDTFAAYIPEK